MSLMLVPHHSQQNLMTIKLKEQIQQLNTEDSSLQLSLNEELQKLNNNMIQKIIHGENIIEKKSKEEQQLIHKQIKTDTKIAELEELIKQVFREGVISKKEMEQKCALIESQREFILSIIGNEQEEKNLELKLGLVTAKKDVQTLHQLNNIKVDKIEFKKEVRQAQSLVRKLNDEKKEREQQKLQKQQEYLQKLQKESEEELMKQKEEIEKKQQYKIKHKEEILRRILEKEEERKKFREETKKKLQEITQQKPLYQQYEENYKNNIEMTQLEIKKKQLEDMRNFYKPIDHNELMEHAAKYERIKTIRNEEIRQNREKSMQDEKEHIKLYKFKPNMEYSSKIRYQQEQDQINEERRKLQSKIQQYAKDVKELHWPKVSQKKQLELEQIKENLRSQRVRRSSRDQSNRLLPISSARPDRNQLLDQEYEDATQASKGGMYSVREEGQVQIKKRKIDWKKLQIYNPSTVQNSLASLNPYSTKNQSPIPVNKSVDYLKDMRAKRYQDDKDGVKQRKNNDAMIDKYLNDPNLNELEKLEIIRKRAEMMEKKAQRDELLIKTQQGSTQNDYGKGNVEKTIAVNDMYIEAIQAKLKILDKI